MNEIGLIEQIAIVQAQMTHEFWLCVGLLSAAVIVALLIGLAIYFTRDQIDFIMRKARENPVASSILTPMFWSLVTYAAVKAIVPAVQQCDFNLNRAVETQSGVVRYHRFANATNDIAVAMNAGLTTNTIASVSAGQFYYEYTPTAYDGSDADISEYGFYVRDAISNEWTKATNDLAWDLPASYLHYFGYLAHLPDNADPEHYRFWYIGREADLPEIVIEGGEGIVIDRFIVQSGHVRVEFHAEDKDLAKTNFVYVLQSRITRQDILMDWQEVARTTAHGSGAFDFDGYTVGEYREYRIYADKEVAE